MRVLLKAALAAVFALTLHSHSYAQAPEQHLPGQWSALSPMGTTTVFLKLNDNPTKNTDGSISFTGRMWSEGAVRDGGADLSIAKLEGGKLAVAYPAGTGSLTYDGKTLTGHITYGQAVLQPMRFEKK